MILSNLKITEESEEVRAKILPFKSGIRHNGVSFPAAQSQSKQLLVDSSRLQELMEANRRNGLQIKQQLSQHYRLLALRDASQDQLPSDSLSIGCLRQKVSELETEHVRLHKQFITKQIQFRQTISDQRRQLVEMVNRTRARTVAVESGVALVASTGLDCANESNESFDDDRTVLGRLMQA